MSELRTIVRLHAAQRDDIGDLVTRRPLPTAQLRNIGAFLFLNHHGPQVYPPRNAGLPFGPHPHRGFETVTFVLEGELTHRDTAGHESIIHEGGVQWMTAGRGLVHAEVSSEAFKRAGGPIELLQLWVNLPARLKMAPPRYVGLQKDAIPKLPVADGKAMLHLIAGSLDGTEGPIESLTGLFMCWAEAEVGARLRFEGLGARDVFLYVARGSIEMGGQPAPAFHLVELGAGDAVEITAVEPSVFVLGHAEPINEPIVAYGPFVMNSQDEIRQAIVDYQAGAFGHMD